MFFFADDKHEEINFKDTITFTSKLLKLINVIIALKKVAPKNKAEELLFSFTKSIDILSECTKTKPVETLAVNITKPWETSSFNIPLELEKYN